jgi:hypothetical protein
LLFVSGSCLAFFFFILKCVLISKWLFFQISIR